MTKRTPHRGADPAAAARRAVEAWREVGSGALPVAAEPLAGGRHSRAVQLRLASGPSVVAKLRPRGALDLERSIHERILPELGVATPGFLGFARGCDGEDDVLFLEHVGGREFQPSDPAHQRAAGRWLGRCHAASARAQIPAVVPRKDADAERSTLATTRARLSETLGNPSLGGQGVSLVSRVLELLDAAAERWAERSACAESAPPVLTHGAFVTRNVRMRGEGSALVALPFDWDHVAVRSPAVDLARVPGASRGFAANASLEPYRAALAEGGLPLDADVVGALAVSGTWIRAAACIGWLVESLAGESPAHALRELDIYRRALAGALGGV